MSKRNFKFTPIQSETLENRQLCAADLAEMGPQPLYTTTAPAAHVALAQPQLAASAGNPANAANPNANAVKAQMNEQVLDNKVNAPKSTPATTTDGKACVPVIAQPTDAKQSKVDTTTNTATGNTKASDTSVPLVTSEKVATPTLQPVARATDLAIDSLVQDRTLSRTMTAEGEAASKATPATPTAPSATAKTSNVGAPLVTPLAANAKLPLGSNATLNLKDTAGKELESVIKALTPSSHRNKVECTEFTVNAKGDVSIKIEVGYKGKLFGFVPWKVTAKIELKTNLFDSSQLRFTLSIGKFPGITIGINSTAIKTALTGWIAGHRGSLKV